MNVVPSSSRLRLIGLEALASPFKASDALMPKESTNRISMEQSRRSFFITVDVSSIAMPYTDNDLMGTANDANSKWSRSICVCDLTYMFILSLTETTKM